MARKDRQGTVGPRVILITGIALVILPVVLIFAVQDAPKIEPVQLEDSGSRGTVETITTTSAAVPTSTQPTPAEGSTMTRSSREERAGREAKRRAVAALKKIRGAKQALVDGNRDLAKRISDLSNKLQVTGKRNERRHLVTEIGKAKGELARERELLRRCREEAFDTDDWQVAMDSYREAERFFARGEWAAAASSYDYLTKHAEELLPICQEIDNYDLPKPTDSHMEVSTPTTLPE